MPDYDISYYWRKAGLTPVLYHFTFSRNLLSIIRDKAFVANKGWSICRNSQKLVSLSERMTKGLVEFCGDVVFEFDALRLYYENPHLSPRDYGLREGNTASYEDFPFFEHEWIASRAVRLEPSAINRVLFVTGRRRRPASFTRVARTLRELGIPCTYIAEVYLPDNITSDTIRYFVRLHCWSTFRRLSFRSGVDNAPPNTTPTPRNQAREGPVVPGRRAIRTPAEF